MENQDDELIPTRATLLGRLKNSRDQSSWAEFFDTYSKLIHGMALKAGLNERDAKEVLQATMDAVAERLPTLKYDPKIGSFKAWLRNLTRIQIISVTLRRRTSPGEPAGPALSAKAESSGEAVDQMWEKEWENNLLGAALANVKRRLDPKKYQVYDFYVNKGWAPEKVAAAFGLTVDDVNSAKRDITEMVKAEVKRLEEKML
jgi:RNA polymerase sigma-70 factor (ECF subfamily)